jgi:hypothetical protein
MRTNAAHLGAKLLARFGTILRHGSDGLKVKRGCRALLLQSRRLELDAHRAGGTGRSTANKLCVCETAAPEEPHTLLELVDESGA